MKPHGEWPPGLRERSTQSGNTDLCQRRSVGARYVVISVFDSGFPLRRWRVGGMQNHNGKLPFVDRLSALFACGGVTQEPANGTGERIRAQLPGAVGTSAMLRLERLPWSGPHPRKAGQGSDAAKWKPPPPAGRKALGPTHANRGQYRGTQRPQ